MCVHTYTHADTHMHIHMHTHGHHMHMHTYVVHARGRVHARKELKCFDWIEGVADIVL